jgi:ubiquinone/menaquinone biosynthesis C-methylase UbiE
MYQQLAKIVGEENIQTTSGLHETIRVEDGWASLVIGQCVLDEFRNVSRAASEISRVLTTGGTAMLSGPVSRTRTLRFERQDKPPIEFLSMREVERNLSQHGLTLLQTHDLTEEIKTELLQSGRGSSVLDFDSSMDYVLVKVAKD